jgi:Flp pilus assembly protein TadG
VTTRIRCLVRRVREDDRGSGYIAAFLVLFGVLTFAGVGVLVDSARIVTAERQASAAAFEAARAGAQAVNLDTGRDGTLTIDPDTARNAALDAAAELLAGTNGQVRAVMVTVDEVVVTISRRVDPWFPVVSGRTVVETGRARLAVGITEEGQ